MHARPFDPVVPPRHYLHFAVLSGDGDEEMTRAALASMARARGQALPAPNASFHRLASGPWDVRWEQHTEFMTVRLGTRKGDGDKLFGSGSIETLGELGLRPTGQLLVATRLTIVPADSLRVSLDEIFDRSSLCIVEAEAGAARVATDFLADPTGFTRILVLDEGLTDLQAGALVQRLLELETYRTLALLGLPVARSAAPLVRDFEHQLAGVTRAIADSTGVGENQALLTRLTDLAARLEALAAESSFRFGASRAYGELVEARIKAIHERPYGTGRTFSAFFARRLTPAIATCNAIEKRQDTLSRKLLRTAELLRTRIQFELERQNRDLLASMNRRAQMQLRLQQTVEGLSIAAVSYYVVGLIGYISKGFEGHKLLGLTVSASLVTAVSVPVVIAVVWLLLRRATRRFRGHDGHADRP
ncbi:MAG: DUF3422 family protein [Rhizobiales bacterium]|nr:DUF3422 family protein [Hyphomicrobiales bacterium]